MDANSLFAEERKRREARTAFLSAIKPGDMIGVTDPFSVGITEAKVTRTTEASVWVGVGDQETRYYRDRGVEYAPMSTRYYRRLVPHEEYLAHVKQTEEGVIRRTLEEQIDKAIRRGLVPLERLKEVAALLHE